MWYSLRTVLYVILCSLRTRRRVSRFTRVSRCIRKRQRDCVMAGRRSFPDTNLLRNLFPARNSRKGWSSCLVSASVWQENRGQRTRERRASHEWRNVKLNEGGEEGGGWGGRGGGRRREEDEREESPPSFERSHNVTCERCLLSHNDEPVVDDAIMVGSRTCERADRKSRFPTYEDARSHADLRMGALQTSPTCHATHSRAFPRCIKLHYLAARAGTLGIIHSVRFFALKN